MEITPEFIKTFNEFKDYLLSLDKASAKGDDTIVYDFGSRIGKIVFFIPYLEMTVEENGENIFLLQTEMISKTQIDEYLKSFFDCLESRDQRIESLHHDFKDLKILFVCSCGVFSSLFANKCNEKAKELGFDVSYNACSVEKLAEVEKDYDRIYFLPQISYVLRRESFQFKGKIKVLPTMFVARDDIESILSYTLSHK